MFEPVQVDYSNPLGISKKEWERVLGANFSILLMVYLVACAFTLSGNDFFVINYENEALSGIDSFMRSRGLISILQSVCKCVELCIVFSFVRFRPVRWYVPLAYVAADLALCYGMGSAYSSTASRTLEIICLSFAFLPNGEGVSGKAARLGEAAAVSLILNGMIAILRRAPSSLSLSLAFALNTDYDLSLILALGFLALKGKKGVIACPTILGASGSSRTSTKLRPKKREKTKTDVPPAVARRIRKMRIRAAAVQTVALIFVAVVPAFLGKGVEFLIMFSSFTITRLCLGFKKSLHFKSEALCVSCGSVLFIVLSLLCPSAESSIFFSLTYGCVIAVAFRLYWELHDLILYRKASRNDRYAMAYCALKGNISPSHVKGVMTVRGYGKEETAMMQEYMNGIKISAIAADFNYSKIWTEQKLSSIVEGIYAAR